MVPGPCLDASHGGVVPPSHGHHSGPRTAAAPAPLNRLRLVREQQGLTLRTISRRSGVPVRQLRCEEEPTADLPLSALHRWQSAMEVPLSELLAEPEGALSIVVSERAKLLRVMKTALSICETARDEQTRRLGYTLCQQLRDLMPELAEQTAWPSVGSRRGRDDVGRIAGNPFRVDAPPDDP